MIEFRALRALLREDAAAAPGKATAKKVIDAVAAATTKFIEGYADALGKGAVGLTIGAASALLFQVGLAKEVLTLLWDHLRLGK